MKKIIFSIVALLATAGTATAQNALSVADVTVPQNSESTLTVSFQFDAADTYTGYSFNLEIPSDLEFVMDGETDVAYVKGDCHDTSHSVTANLSDGMVKVAGLSLSSKPLSGMSGVLLQFTVRPVSPTLTIGQTYQGTIKDILLVPVEGDKQSLAASNFTITIGEPVELRTILDETSTTVPAAATGVDVRVKRTINANEWSTICLPFDMTWAQVESAFGEDVQLADFVDYDTTEDAGNNVTGITINFSDANAIVANHPYIIKVSAPITYAEGFTVDGVDIDPDEESAYVEYNNGQTGKKKVVYGTFEGTYHAQTDVPENCLFLSENKFWYSAGLTKMKAFRAYFDLLDVLAEVEGAGARIMIDVNGETTDIRDINRQEMNDDRYYTLDGRIVANPSKGIYIKNGKKVIIK